MSKVALAKHGDDLVFELAGEKSGGLTVTQRFIDASVAWEKAQQGDVFDPVKRDRAQLRYLQARARVESARGADDVAAATLVEAARVKSGLGRIEGLAAGVKDDRELWFAGHEFNATNARYGHDDERRRINDVFGFGDKIATRAANTHQAASRAWLTVGGFGKARTGAQRHEDVRQAVALSRDAWRLSGALVEKAPTVATTADVTPGPSAPCVLADELERAEKAQKPEPAPVEVVEAPAPTVDQEPEPHATVTPIRPAATPKRRWSKADNRALAAELRTIGLVPNGDVWVAAKQLREEGAAVTRDALEAVAVAS